MAGWTNPDHDDEVTNWMQRFSDAMAPHATGGVYVNILGTGEEDRVRAAYGENYDRLAELKRLWDPENLFNRNHNIPPRP
jgi:FAD/FMN-containing dehydrogenase